MSPARRTRHAGSEVESYPDQTVVARNEQVEGIENEHAVSANDVPTGAIGRQSGIGIFSIRIVSVRTIRGAVRCGAAGVQP